jgi:hypothetical protein
LQRYAIFGVGPLHRRGLRRLKTRPTCRILEFVAQQKSTATRWLARDSTKSLFGFLFLRRKLITPFFTENFACPIYVSFAYPQLPYRFVHGLFYSEAAISKRLEMAENLVVSA